MLKRTFLGVVAVLAFELPASGAIIINNPFVDGNSQTAMADDRIKGMGFTMGGAAFDLNSVSLRMCFATGADVCTGIAGASLGIPVLRLFSDNGGLPGSELLTFTNPAFGLGYADYTFLAPSAFTLQANTSYWLVLHSSNDGEFTWEANNPQTTPSGAFAIHLGSLFGAAGAPTPPTVGSGILNIYSLDGTAVVPEPSTILLSIVGLGVIAGIRLRRIRG